MTTEDTKTIGKRKKNATFADEAAAYTEFLVKMMPEMIAKDPRYAQVDIMAICEFLRDEKNKDVTMSLIATADLLKKSCPGLWEGYWRE